MNTDNLVNATPHTILLDLFEILLVSSKKIVKKFQMLSFYIIYYDMTSRLGVK